MSPAAISAARSGFLMSTTTRATGHSSSVNEEWRKLIQGSAPSPINTILASNFPTAGQSLYLYAMERSRTNRLQSDVQAPCVPKTSDPAKLALYTADGLTPGNPFPNNVIPANLIDQNAVLELNAGTFPKPNDGPTQYIASIPAPENIREDVVRIDHSINSKYQLMGHYLHDAMAKTFFPPLWGRRRLSDGRHGHDESLVYGGHQAHADLFAQLLNETAFLYSGNKITLTPIAGAGNSFVLPSGWTATSFFPVANNAGHDMPEIDLQGSPLNQTWTESYYPWKNGYEGFQYRDDVSWTQGPASVQVWLRLAARLQEPATAGQHPGNRGFQLEQLLRRLVCQFPARHGLQLYPAGVPGRQALGQQQLQLLRQRQLARHSAADPQPWASFRRTAACLRAV